MRTMKLMLNRDYEKLKRTLALVACSLFCVAYPAIAVDTAVLMTPATQPQKPKARYIASQVFRYSMMPVKIGCLAVGAAGGAIGAASIVGGAVVLGGLKAVEYAIAGN